MRTEPLLDRLSRDILTLIVGFTALVLMAWLAWITFTVESWSCEPGVHVVQPGESAWSILSERCDGDIRQIVYEHGFGGHLYPGDKLVIKAG